MAISQPPEQTLNLERLKGLYELSARLNSEFELSSLLEFVVDRALSLTGGRRGLILLSDDHRHELGRIAVVRGENLDPARLEQMLKFVSTTVIKDVLAQGEPRLVSDLETDRRYDGLTSQNTLQFKNVRSVLAFPLKMEAKLVGLMYIDHPKKGIFSQHDFDFLSAFANQAAVAIHRARQHERQIEELTRLNQLGQDITQTLDLDDVLSRIITEALHLLKVKNGSVLLLDPLLSPSELYFAKAVRHEAPSNIEQSLPLEGSIAGWVMGHRQPALVNDVQKDDRWFGEVQPGFNTRSLLCVPLTLNDEPIGVLEVLNRPPDNPFTSSDTALLQALGASAAIAIQNARLFQEARQVQYLRALNEMALALSSKLNPKTILQTGLSKALSTLPAGLGVLEIYAPEEGKQSDLPPAQLSLTHPPDSNPDSAQVAVILAQGKTFITSSNEEYRLSPLDTGTLALAKINLGHNVPGFLALFHPDPRPYSADDINFLVGVARIIGLAMQNVAHYNQVNRKSIQLSYLNEIGTALTSSLNVSHVLKVIIEGVNVLMETERTSVFLIDPSTNDLVLRYSNQGDTNIRLKPPWQGIAGWVATHDEPALVNDTLRDDRHLRDVAIETGYNAQSILCVPLKLGEQVVGVVEVLNKRDRRQFTEEHQSLLLELSRWAAIALHNAQLYNELEDAYQTLGNEQERRIAAETRAAMAAIILDMAHTMNNVVGAIRVWAGTLEERLDTSPQAPLIDFEKQIRRIWGNANEAIRLISSMTDPLEQATIAPTDVHQCLDLAIQSCWWPDSVQLVQDYAVSLPPAQANAKRLEAVFHNLISNANQAMADTGGQVEITTWLSAGESIKISIADNGPGIEQTLQKRIFNPGVSGREGGLGIGLWLVETFIAQFGGQIEFQSQPNHKTRFVITLKASSIP